MRRVLKLLTAAVIFSLLLFFISCTEPVIPQGYALIYGVADYGGEYDLNYTDDDAVSMADLLKAKGWDVRLRIDSKSTLAQLKTDVADLKTLSKSTDRLLFYYSGHGVYTNLNNTEPTSAADSYDEILLLYNSITTFFDFQSGTQTAEDVLSVTVSDDSLAELLSDIPAATKTVILDNCYSGGFFGDGYTIDTTMANYTKYEYSTVFQPAEAVKLYAGYTPNTYDLSQSSFSILSASGESEESFEPLASQTPNIGHGYFTYFLLQTPSKADFNLDGYISLTEAYQHTAASIDNMNTGNTTYDYMPHVAAFPIDPVLFKAD
jgi:hypothetical protein